MRKIARICGVLGVSSDTAYWVDRMISYEPTSNGDFFKPIIVREPGILEKIFFRSRLRKIPIYLGKGHIPYALYTGSIPKQFNESEMVEVDSIKTAMVIEEWNPQIGIRILMVTVVFAFVVSLILPLF